MSTPTLAGTRLCSTKPLTLIRGVRSYGIPAPVEIPAHRFGITWQNRLWLFNDQSKNKTQVGVQDTIRIAYLMVLTQEKYYLVIQKKSFAPKQSFQDIPVGFTSLVVFKKNAIYILDGLSIKDYKIYTVANSTGCIAPLTLKKCDIG